jgi:hypothetical protein
VAGSVFSFYVVSRRKMTDGKHLFQLRNVQRTADASKFLEFFEWAIQQRYNWVGPDELSLEQKCSLQRRLQSLTHSVR